MGFAGLLERNVASLKNSIGSASGTNSPGKEKESPIRLNTNSPGK